MSALETFFFASFNWLYVPFGKKSPPIPEWKICLNIAGTQTTNRQNMCVCQCSLWNPPSFPHENEHTREVVTCNNGADLPSAADMWLFRFPFCASIWEHTQTETAHHSSQQRDVPRAFIKLHNAGSQTLKCEQVTARHVLYSMAVVIRPNYRCYVMVHDPPVILHSSYLS